MTMYPRQTDTWRAPWQKAARILLACILLLAAGSVAQPFTDANLKTPVQEQKDTLVVGSEQDYPPFATGLTDDDAGGFTVDLWRAVAAETGLKYTLRVRPFHELLEEFRRGEIDVLINLAQSDERHRFADFTVPHVVVHGAIFVRKSQQGIHTEADLANKSIIVLNADLAHDYALTQGWGKHLVLVNTAADGMRLLASGKHDALLLSKLVGIQTLQALDLDNIVALKSTVGFSQKFAFAVHEGQSELLGRLNEGMAITRLNGSYNSLYEKWFSLYEEKEVGLRDVLKYLAPAILIFTGLLGHFYYRRQLERKQAEKIQQESRQLLDSIIENIPDMIFVKQASDLRFKLFNRAGEILLGRGRKTLLGLNDYDLFPREQADFFTEKDRVTLTQNQVMDIDEESIETPSGTRILHTKKLVLRDENGLPQYLLGISEDITDRKLAETKLLTLSTAIEQSPVSIVITDINANIEYVNPRFTEVTGYGSDEVVGHNPRILQSGLTPEAAYLELWDKITQGNVWHGELINKRKNGDIYWEEAYISPVKNKQDVLTHYVAAKIDITLRKRGEAALKESESRFRFMLENSPIAVRITNIANSSVVFANQSYAELLGCEPDKVIGINPVQYYAHPEDYIEVTARLNKGERITNKLVELIIPNSHSTPKWALASYLQLEYQGAPAIMGWFYDITDRRAMEVKIQHLAHYDPLTDLPNRTLFTDRLQQALSVARREKGRLALMFIDLDKFKPINDTHGHQTGDLVLKEVARRIEACLRESDTVARIGGDEFVVLLHTIETEHDALVVAEKIRVTLNQTMKLVGLKLDISSSTGVVIYPEHGTDEKQLIRNADTAMYYAKSGGRDNVKIYRDEMQKVS